MMNFMNKNPVIKLRQNSWTDSFKKWDKRIESRSVPFATTTSKHPKTSLKWNSVVGLEIHAQILSQSKLFSGAETSFLSPVNTNVALFDCAIPGTLPVLNKRCVEAGVITALALSCKLNHTSTFDRKHYFYADLPAGYQITQQRQPLAQDGTFSFFVYTPGVHKKPYRKSSKLKQLQLEQDSGKSLHDEDAKISLIDLNRAGIPLMELVFEPDLSDGEEAAALVKELALILQTLGTCSSKMEEGALRVDANVSVNKLDEPLGVRTEIKNIGSARAVATAVQFEIKRQISELEKGHEIVNETRSWDAVHNITVSMRDKEEKQDYRFMPEPNLPPLRLHFGKKEENNLNLIDVNLLRTQIPELPEQTRTRLIEQYGLTFEKANILTNNTVLLQMFHDILNEKNTRDPMVVTNILLNEMLTVVNKNNMELESCVLTHRHIGEAIDLLHERIINNLIMRKIFKELVSRPNCSTMQIVEENNWFQITDKVELKQLCQEVLDGNPDIVKKYKKGKIKVFGALIGQVGKRTDFRADLSSAEKILKEMLST
ncbi:glutamyl-tRNA(Gln) amidotransferase subunit B, mitochondrial [Orussus abietinus]|uniref:glutamyl-tRNA(Gln) amidotransferase subunit B, mitochondrial n=1 Tax=Orussus abietinus TaxID=222816 RepID=UPI00062503E2|nr:glutamyl-tRNA(Gln) amidotransferase subunit B, mitochondrial [Orussus abietinus]